MRGVEPELQPFWDERAAGNFIGGGTGAGLLLWSAIAASGHGTAIGLPLFLALAFIGVGLFCVWMEIGRPLRALNVFFHARTSWMTREAIVAGPLFLCGLIALLSGWLFFAWLAALIGLVFLYCQARILQACKGIPAWREPMTVPLVAATGLAEGAGLYWILAPWWGQGNILSWLTLGALLLLRFVLGSAWRRRLAAALRPASLRAVDRTALGWKAGSLLPLALVLIGAAAPPLPSVAALLLQLLAGLLALGGGALFKFMLVTKAGFNQGFALPHLPVRGVRRG